MPPDFANLTCPTPRDEADLVLLGHGSGGRLSADLLRAVFLPAFGNAVLDALEDQATVRLAAGAGPRIAFTTDSYVVRPLFFPGGDIGRLAVNGTVNDLAVGGARPLFLSAAFILEEGLPLADLRRVMLAACPSVRCMRDPTRGGLASALNELAAASKVGVKLTEAAVPLRPEVRAACELLGLDPLYVACEGRLIAVVPPG